MLSDKFLIWKFNNGSTDALRAIYEKYRSTMLTVATTLCNDVNTAEDIVQDSFVSFARKGGQLKVHGNLKAYLTKSVVNRTRDWYRYRSSKAANLFQDDLAQSHDCTSESSAICNEQIQRLAAALALIDPDIRETLVLRTRGGMTYREIAEIQDVSIPTVQRRYHSGLNELRILLNGELET